VWHGLSFGALCARLKERLWLKCFRCKSFATTGSPGGNGGGQDRRICYVSPGILAICEKTTYWVPRLSADRSKSTCRLGQVKGHFSADLVSQQELASKANAFSKVETKWKWLFLKTRTLRASV
jgi:hypothetical protein